MQRMNSLLLLCCFHLLVYLASLTEGQTRCTTKLNSCQCRTNSGKYIDLAPLANTDDYHFKRIQGPNGNWLYSYNPCYGFKCEGAENVAVCQDDNRLTMQYALGMQDSAEFGYILGDIGLHIKYTSSHTSTKRISIVKLVCDKNVESTFELTDDGAPSPEGSFTYSSTLTSKYVCEVDSLPDRIGGGGMSAGDILLIIFFVGIFLYLLGGFAFNIAVRKTPVGPGALPNTTFWLGVLGYIQEGATLCFAKAKQLFTMRRGGSYESV